MKNINLTENKLNLLIGEISDRLMDKHLFVRGVIKGGQIPKFSEVKQVNNFILFKISQELQSHLGQLQHSWFDYENEEVRDSLRKLSNVLSQNIRIKEADFRPMVEKAVYNSLRLILNPEEAIGNFFFLKSEVIPLSLLKKHAPYFADYDFIIKASLKYYEKNQMPTVEKKLFFQIFNRIIQIFEQKEGKSIEVYRKGLFLKLTGRDLDQFLALPDPTPPKPKVTTPPSRREASDRFTHRVREERPQRPVTPKSESRPPSQDNRTSAQSQPVRQEPPVVKREVPDSPPVREVAASPPVQERKPEVRVEPVVPVAPIAEQRPEPPVQNTRPVTPVQESRPVTAQEPVVPVVEKRPEPPIQERKVVPPVQETKIETPVSPVETQAPISPPFQPKQEAPTPPPVQEIAPEAKVEPQSLAQKLAAQKEESKGTLLDRFAKQPTEKKSILDSALSQKEEEEQGFTPSWMKKEEVEEASPQKEVPAPPQVEVPVEPVEPVVVRTPEPVEVPPTEVNIETQADDDAIDLFGSREEESPVRDFGVKKDGPSLAEKMAGNTENSSLNQRLSQGKEIRLEQIPVNKQFQFVQRVFGGSSVKFKVVLDKINKTGSATEAEGVLKKYVFNAADVNPNDKIAQEFILMVRNRFN